MKKQRQARISFTIEPIFKRAAVALAKKDKDTVSAILRGLLCDYLYERDMIHLRPSVVCTIKQAEKDFQLGKNISNPFHTIEEITAHLKSPIQKVEKKRR